MSQIPASLTWSSPEVIAALAVPVIGALALCIVAVILSRRGSRWTPFIIGTGLAVAAAAIANICYLFLPNVSARDLPTAGMMVGDWKIQGDAEGRLSLADDGSLELDVPLAGGIGRLTVSGQVEASGPADKPRLWNDTVELLPTIARNGTLLDVQIRSGEQQVRGTFTRASTTALPIMSGEFLTWQTVIWRIVIALILLCGITVFRASYSSSGLLLGFWVLVLWTGVDAVRSAGWWLPASSTSDVIHMALATGGVVLTVLATLPMIRKHTVLARMLLIPGVGAAMLLVVGAGYMINPLGTFSNFMTYDEPTLHQMYWLLGRLVIAIQLISLCAMARARWASTALFVPAALMIMWVGLDTVALTGSERLEIDSDRIVAATAAGDEADISGARSALDDWLRELAATDPELSGIAADQQKALNARPARSVRPIDVLATGSRRFQTFQALTTGEHANPELAALVRTNAIRDLTSIDLTWMAVGAAVFVLGLVVFFSFPNANGFAALCLVLAFAGYLVVMAFGANGLNPAAWSSALGVDSVVWEQRVNAELEWHSWPIDDPGKRWLWAVIIGLPVVFVALIYLRERKSAGLGTRGVLVILRLAVIALLLVALFEPVWRIKRQQTMHSHVLVLLDTSQSMNRVDIYANSWVEQEPDDRGELQARTRTRIRTDLARAGFGDAVFDRLVLESLQGPGNADVRRVFADLTVGADAELEPLLRDLSDFETRARSDRRVQNVRQRIEDRYRALAADFVEHWDPGNNVDAGTWDRMVTDVRDGQIDGFDRMVLGRNSAVQPHAVRSFYVRLLMLLRDGGVPGNDGQISSGTPLEAALDSDLLDAGRRTLADDEAEIVRTDSTVSADGTGTDPASPASLTAGTQTPRFGPMDNFVMELQLRRCLRLWKTARDLCPPGALDLERYRVLANARERLTTILVAREAAAAGGDESARIRLESARSVTNAVDNQMRAMLPTTIDDRAYAQALLEQLLACSQGMRRIDVALELLHPHADLGFLMHEPRFAMLEQLRYSREVWQQLEGERLPNESDADFKERISRTVEGFNSLHIRTFGEDVNGGELPEDPDLLSRALDTLRATGTRTAIGQSADKAMRDLFKRHIRPELLGGVVIISDGLNNTASASAPVLQDVQVDTIGVGSTTQLKKLELFSLKGPETVNKGNLLNLNLRVRADLSYCVNENSGEPGGKKVDVLLYRVVENRNMPGGEEEIPLKFNAIFDQTYPRSHTVTPPPDNARLHGVDRKLQLWHENRRGLGQDVIMEIDPQQGDPDRGISGHFIDFDVPVRLRVRINPKGFKYVDEDTADDNWKDIWVRFTNRKTTVLLIDGRVRYEYRFLSEMLQRDPTIRFQAYNFGWDRSGPPLAHSRYLDDTDPPVLPLTDLPPSETPEDCEKFYENYDVVILGDVKRQMMPDSFLKMLQEFVGKHKGGVVFVAGQQHNPMGFEGSPLEDLVPVKLASLNRNQAVVTNIVKPWTFTPEGMNDEMFRLDPDKVRNQYLWKSLHGFYWFQPIQEAKEGSMVLARHPIITEYSENGRRELKVQTSGGEGYPMIVYMDYAKGCVLYIGSDDLWYIRGGHGNKYYQPVWSQIIARMAARRYDTSDETVELYTTNRNNPVYQYPDRIGVEATVRGKSVEELLRNRDAMQLDAAGRAKLFVEISNTSLNESPTLIELIDERGDRQFRGEFYPPNTGTYEARVRGFPNYNHQFRVTPPLTELAPLGLNLELLVDLAHPRPATEPRRLHAMLPPNTRYVEVEPLVMEESEGDRSLQEDLGDMPLIFILIAILLGCEWIVRKRARLL